MSVTVIKGLYYLMMPQYCYNVGLSNEACESFSSSVNGNTYTIPQTCNSGLSFRFQALDIDTNAIPNMTIYLKDTSTGTIRSAITDSTGNVSFSLTTGCHYFNIGYTLNFTVYAEYNDPSYVSPTITVNVD
jgi:hypothetical protein